MFHMAMYLRQLVVPVLYYVAVIFLFLAATFDAVSVNFSYFGYGVHQALHIR